MAILLFSNNVSSTLQNAIGSGALSCTVAAGTGSKYPNPSAGQYFLLTFVDAATGLLNEICQCTARSGDVLTIVRAQESTAAQNWNAGDFVNMFWTAGAASAMLQQAQQQQQSTNYATDTGTVNAMAITLSPAPSAMSQLVGAPIRVKVAVTNTAATPTLNVNGLGAQNCGVITPTGFQGVGVGGLAVNEIAEFVWDGTQFQLTGYPAPATTAQIQAGTDTLYPLTSLGNKNANPSVLTTTQGYKQFADGVIIQWGQFTTVSGTGEDVTLPIAFPTAQVSCVANSVVTSDLVAVCTKPTVATPLTKIHINAGVLSTAPPSPATGALIRFVCFGY